MMTQAKNKTVDENVIANGYLTQKEHKKRRAAKINHHSKTAKIKFTIAAVALSGVVGCGAALYQSQDQARPSGIETVKQTGKSVLWGLGGLGLLGSFGFSLRKGFVSKARKEEYKKDIVLISPTREESEAWEAAEREAQLRPDQIYNSENSVYSSPTLQSHAS